MSSASRCRVRPCSCCACSSRTAGAGWFPQVLRAPATIAVCSGFSACRPASTSSPPVLATCRRRSSPDTSRTFYPGVADAASSPFLTVGAGQSQSSADITLVRQSTARVSGIVRDAQGRPGLVGSLSLVPSQSASSLVTPVGARVGDNGAFEFPNVPPGRYVIQAYRGTRNRSTEGEFGALSVSVGERDVEGLIVQATAGSTIVGPSVVLRLGAGSGATARRHRHRGGAVGSGSRTTQRAGDGGHSPGLDVQPGGDQRAAPDRSDAHPAGLGAQGNPRAWHRRHRSADRVGNGGPVDRRRRGGADRSPHARWRSRS